MMLTTSFIELGNSNDTGGNGASKEAEADADGWCLLSTVMASLSALTHCNMSFSSAVNSAACFSRIAVAVSSDFTFFAISFSRAGISTLSLADSAAYVSIFDVKSVMHSSASLIAFVLSLSFVSHQQAILS